MSDQKQTAGRHWSKDFVEHLRSVHFALIAVCVGAIVLAAARTQSEMSRAHEQLKQIHDVVKTWGDGYLLEPIAPTTENHNEDSQPQILAVDLPAGTVYLSIQFVGPKSFVRLNSDAARYAPPKTEKDKFLLNPPVSPPQSLSEFQRLWDSTRSGATINTPIGLPTECLFKRTSQPWSELEHVPCRWLDTSNTHNAVKIEFKLANANQILSGEHTLRETLDVRQIKPFDYFYTFYQWPESLREFRVALPVRSFQRGWFDAEGRLLGKHPGWHRGSFETEFRELATISKEYNTIDLDTAERILAAEERRSAESLDAFGMKFPAETVIRRGAGAIVILAVQFYLWAHLFEFRRKLRPSDEGWNVAWMGVYETRPARFMLYGSILLLPIAAILALGIRGLYIGDGPRYTSWVLLIATSTATLLLSILICAAFPKKKELI
jgi:hypothetical protein